MGRHKKSIDKRLIRKVEKEMKKVAVTANYLLDSLELKVEDINQNQQKTYLLNRILKEGVEKGRYDSETQAWISFIPGHQYQIYFLKGKRQSYVPFNVGFKNYKALKESIEPLLEKLPKQFSQKDVYAEIRPFGPVLNIGLRNIEFSLGSILNDYVAEGLLTTKDAFNYKKAKSRKRK